MAAIEDAVVLGCDAVNLSLGTNSPGGSRNANEVYQAIMDSLEEPGTVGTWAAGNNYGWTIYMDHMYDYDSGVSYLYADDVNMMTGGTPRLPYQYHGRRFRRK